MRSVQCLPPLEDGSIVLKSGYCFVVSFVRVEDQIGRMGDPFVVKGIETCHCWYCCVKSSTRTWWIVSGWWAVVVVAMVAVQICVDSSDLAY